MLYHFHLPVRDVVLVLGQAELQLKLQQKSNVLIVKRAEALVNSYVS